MEGVLPSSCTLALSVWVLAAPEAPSDSSLRASGIREIVSYAPVLLGVGAIVRKPVAVDDAPQGGDDSVAVRPRLTLSLVFDHRVIDGASAARFLDRIVQLVEDPVMLLVSETWSGE